MSHINEKATYSVELMWDNLEGPQIRMIDQWYRRKVDPAWESDYHVEDNGWYTLVVTHTFKEGSPTEALDAAFALAPTHILTDQKLCEIHVREQGKGWAIAYGQ